MLAYFLFSFLFFYFFILQKGIVAVVVCPKYSVGLQQQLFEELQVNSILFSGEHILTRNCIARIKLNIYD